MYFLYQIKAQWVQTVFAYEAPIKDGPEGGAPVDTVTVVSDARLQEDFTPEQIADMSSTEILKELKERLDGLKAAESVVGPEAQVLIRFCNKIRRDGVPDDERKDFEITAGIALRKIAEYQRLTKEGHDIQGEIHVHLAKISKDVDAQIEKSESDGKETVGDVVLSEDEKQELTKKIETETGIHAELVKNIREKYLKDLGPLEDQSTEIKALIQELGVLQEQPETELNVSEKLSDLENKNSALRQLDFKFEKTLRDETVVGKDGETLGEVRMSLVEEKFKEIKEKGTEVQKNIIGDKEFSELSTADFGRLANTGFDLSKFLLVDAKGNAFDGKFEEGQEFIMNAGGRNDLGGYLSGYIFNFRDVKSISIDGVDYIRDTTSNPSVGFKTKEGVALGTILDGKKVTISSVEKLSDEDYELAAANLKRTYDYDRGSEITADLIHQFEQDETLNGFSWKDFLKAMLSGDLLTFAKQLDHLVNGRFHKDPDTAQWTQYDEVTGEYIPVTEADMSLASLEGFPASYRANLIRSCRMSGISVDSFIDEMNKECEMSGFPPNRFVSLIGHESGWKSWIRNQSGSSAYGLGQMIDSTWEKYANGGDRNNPLDQMRASLRYLKYIVDFRKCSPEDACAFYNTGENFAINNSPAPASYVRQNQSIVKLIPSGMRGDGITSREYFIAAVAYYNDINFSEANSRSKYGNHS